MTTRNARPTPIAFGRDQWEEVTGLPLQTAAEMVRLKLIRTLKIGRRRLYLHADLQRMFARLAETGEHVEPRKMIDAQKAADAAAGLPPKKAGPQNAKRGA
jgi:hypothetical protein